MFLAAYHPPICSQVLVEKEWCSFGHKFAQRCGHHEGKTYTDKQRSPVFVQWLDCVWQLLHQFPNEFGFNALILSVLFEQVREGKESLCACVVIHVCVYACMYACMYNMYDCLRVLRTCSPTPPALPTTPILR